MLKYILCYAFVLVSSVAHSNPVSLGFEIGSNTGLRGKFGLSNSAALNTGLSYSSYGDFGSTFYVDYIKDKARVFNLGQVEQVNFYYGIGGVASNFRRGQHNGETRLGVRVPFGLEKSVFNPDLDFFGEITPVIQFVSSTEFYLAAVLGLRIRF